MTAAYINNNVIYQPQLVRWRSRHRGIRESQKINLEMQQIRYDLLQVNYIADTVESNLSTQLYNIEYNVLLSNLDYDTATVEATTGAMQDIISRVQKLTRYTKLLQSNYWHQP